MSKLRYNLEKGRNLRRIRMTCALIQAGEISPHVAKIVLSLDDHRKIANLDISSSYVRRLYRTQFSAAKLAVKLGITTRPIYNYEKGYVSFLSDEKLRILLNIYADFLLKHQDDYKQIHNGNVVDEINSWPVSIISGVPPRSAPIKGKQYQYQVKDLASPMEKTMPLSVEIKAPKPIFHREELAYPRGI